MVATKTYDTAVVQKRQTMSAKLTIYFMILYKVVQICPTHFISPTHSKTIQSHSLPCAAIGSYRLTGKVSETYCQLAKMANQAIVVNVLITK